MYKLLGLFFCKGSREKSSSLNGRAIKRGGGGVGVKGRPLREKKNFFFTFVLILLPFKNKNYSALDNLSKYGDISS